MPPRSRLWLWVVLVCAAIAGAGGAVTQVLRVETPPAPPPVSPVGSLVARADAALAAFRAPQFEQAIALYRQALPSFPDDAHLLSALSRSYAQYAESLRTSAAISARIANGGKAGASLDDLPEALRLAHEAKLYGQRAAQRNPGNEEAGVALSDALRLTGNLVAARAEIDRVRATQRVPDAETLRVAALLAIDEAKGDLAAGRKLAGLAVAHDPRSVSARLLLARCLADERDFAGARVQLDAVRGFDPTLPALAEHEAELSALRKARVVTSTSTATDATRAGAAASAAPAGVKSDASFADALELTRKGERLLENGSVSSAKDAFEEALRMQPGLPRARTGLGYVHLERAQLPAALSDFKSAAGAGHGEAIIGLGDTYRRLGRMKEALGAYRSYLKKFPRGSRASIAQRQIELLEEQVKGGP